MSRPGAAKWQGLGLRSLRPPRGPDGGWRGAAAGL